MKKKTVIITNAIIVGFLAIFALISLPTSSLATASANPNVIYQGNTSNNRVCFMINVYWGTEYIEDMLDVFDVYNVKTTFFIGGMWASKNVDLLKEISSRGHEMANHGYYHKDQDKLTKSQNEDEIMMTHKLIKANLGIDMNLFAPPSGAFDDEVVDVATSLNYKTIMWTRDTIDWRDKDSDLVYKRAIKNLKNGDLILMHPTNHTLDALSSILAYAQNNGFLPSTVSQVIE